MSIECHLGDCLEIMPTLPAGSVNMVLADLPYGTTQNKWDSVIPLPALWAQYARLCNGPVVLTASQPFTSALVMSNLKQFRYDWVWAKGGKATGHLNAKKQPLREKEDVLIFCASTPPYYPQMSAGTPFKDKAGKDHAAATSMTESYGAFTNKREANSGTRYPRQILNFPRVERDTLHPTQKPVALMEYLIRTYTNEGDTVLDNTMGSGTTGVACLNTGRNFIGIEKEEKYYDIACQRLAKV